ncbi:hypothetical protein Tco_0979520 [Tanacetum coccineum]
MSESHHLLGCRWLLSRISSEAELNALVLTSIASDLLQQVKESCLKDLVLKDIIQHDNSYRKDKLHGLREPIISDMDLVVFVQVVENHKIGQCGFLWTLLNTTPFEAVYGQTPPLHIPYVVGEGAVEAVDRTLQAREEALRMLKFHLKRAQDRMLNQANKHISDRTFEIGM